MNKRNVLFILLIFSGLYAPAQPSSRPLEDYIISRTTDQNGLEIVGVLVPGRPPDGHHEPIASPSRSSVTLPLVPAYDWSFGCSATSAAMAAGYYDNNGYANMYTGPTNGGAAPLNNSAWGYIVINGETRAQCPISATRNGLDGRTASGHVDDYWISYGNTSPDPYITNGWTQHTYGDCTGDYMGTNQSALGCSDGATTFYLYFTGEPLHNYTGCEPGGRDGCHGLRDFFESRGYTVVQNYTQCIFGYNGNTIGFTFNQYKTEIDNGRVVLIQVEGHTMLGCGYDDSNNTVYVHDTWDYNTHSMTWGGSYAGLAHYAVTVVELAPMIWANASFTADNLVPELSTTVNFTDQSTGSPALNSWSWTFSPNTVTFMEGTSATSRHPKVRFDAAGFYTVTLVAANSNTSDTEVKTNYIHAIDCSDQPFPFTEDFSDGALPGCWSMTDHQGNGQVWLFTNPANRTVSTTTSANGFALLDSDYYGSGYSQNCDLVTPMLDFTEVPGVVLVFQHFYQHYTGSSATLSYSTNGGISWNVIQTWTANTNNPATFSQDLSDLLAGQDSVKIKWNYTGSFGWFWAVDDIEIHSEVPGLWVGAMSSEWNNPGNWADGLLPSGTTDITVWPQADNWPVSTGNLVLGTNCGNITLNGGAQMTINGDLTISQGKTLSFTGAGQLNLMGDWINSGTFIPGQGTVNFTGTLASDIILTNPFSTSAGEYTLGTFTAGMTLLSGATTGPANTDNGFALVPVGFEFNFAGTVNDSVWITTNGCIHMQATGSGNPNNSQLFSTAELNRVMAPWWDDLTEDGTSNLRYKTEGTAPNRVFTTEWYRFASYRTGATSRLKFQVKLYETTHVIEFHYGTMEGGTHNASESASIGIEDATGGSGRFIDATTGSSTSGNAALVSPGNWPAVNYRFTPGMLNEVFYNAVVSKTGAPVNILSNTVIAGSLTVSPGSTLNIPAGIVLRVNGTGN